MSQGFLLIGHGTRDTAGTQQFFQLAALLEQQLCPEPVAAALLEFQSPTIAEAWQQLVDRGVDHIDVAPLLLFAAGHAKQDIPEIIHRCQQQTPHITWTQSRPLSRHPAVIELALKRAWGALARCQAGQQRRAFVLVGRGSHDPCAQADTRVLAALLGHRLPVAHSATAFYAMAQPDVPNVLNKLATCGQFDEIIIQPHLLFAGRLHQAILKQVDSAAQQHQAIQFYVADYLWPDPLVAQAIVQRVRGSNP